MIGIRTMIKPKGAQASISGIWYKIGRLDYLFAYDQLSKDWFRHENDFARGVIVKGRSMPHDSSGRIFKKLTKQDKYDIAHSPKKNTELGLIYNRTPQAIGYVIKQFNNRVA